MRKMSMMSLLAAVPLSMCIAQTNGIVLGLTFPEPPLLRGEENSIRLSVKNGSDRPLPLVTSLQDAVQSQVKIELGYTSERYRTLRYSQSVSWDSVVKMADKTLAPGQSHEWDWNEPYNLMAYTELLHSISSLTVTNITVSLQVGNNQWVSTPSFPITVLKEKESKSIEDKAVPVLDTVFRNQFTGQSWSIPLNKLTINDKPYLFTSFGTRVCALPDGEMPAIQDNADGTGFTLVFPTAKQRIRFDWKQMRGELDRNVQ